MAEEESDKMSSPPTITFHEESQADRLSRKMKDAPFVPIGVAGLVVVCVVGAYKYRHRGNMSTSLFLMQLRVTAQSAVVGCMMGGLTYTMWKEYVSSKIKSD